MPDTWLSDVLQAFSLTEDVETYLLGRGLKESTILAEGIVTGRVLDNPVPDKNFRAICGSRGERLAGMLVCPVRAPSGALLGFEARSIHEKRILDFRLPNSKWVPFFLGTRKAMPAIWAGGDIWIVEGLFDLAPLEWVVPSRDAVLATVRAYLGHNHVEFLRRFCKGHVHMVYDMDATGRKATKGWTDETGKRHPGALDLLHRVGLKCSDVTYSGGKDPGEIWSHGGLAAIQAAFA